MRIAIASFAGMPPQFRDDELLMEQLRLRGADVVRRPWDDPEVDWPSFDLVVGRSVWDYVLRHDEFMEWLDSAGPRLENAPELMRWNSDKHYLGDLAAAGVPVVDTTYVEPGMPPPPIESEIVVKPAISAGGRDTGRFGPRSAEAGAALIEKITSAGGTAMVQPFLASVDLSGETAVVMIDGEVSHVLRKGAILAADEVAPVRSDDDLGVAEVMYDPDLVLAGTADDDELLLAERVIAGIRERFGVTPLYARVDMLRGPGGEPVLLELEAIEPNLYFDQAPGAVGRLADAIVARASAA